MSATSKTPSELPGIALGSSAVLHLQRALLVGTIIACSSIFLTRGWVGCEKVGTIRQGLRVLGAEIGLGSDIDDIVGDHETG
jgi:hypothetical protein